MLDVVKSAIRANSLLIRISGVVYAIIIPVLVGVFAVYYEKLRDINPLLFWLPIFIFSGIACIYAYFFGAVPLAAEVYVDLEDARLTISNLSNDIRYMSLLEQQALAWDALIRLYSKQRVLGKSALQTAIGAIMAPVVESGAEYFDFQRKELWNFAVYLWSDELQILAPVWREKHPQHPSTTIGRDWMDGEGHVGHAFRHRQTLITPDAQDPNVQALMASPSKARDYDNEVYRSYVSQPIDGVARGDRPYGVLVATSNHVGRFDRANALVLLHASVIIASLIQLTYDSGA